MTRQEHRIVPAGSGEQRRDPVKALQAASIARRYFMDGKSKTEIADEFGVSRFQVARLLDWARSENLVQIRVLDPSGLERDLSDRLQAAFELTHAVVVSAPRMPEDAIRSKLARVGADYVAARLHDGDSVGVAWGRTIDDLVRFLPDIPPVDTVQIAGGMTPVEAAISGTDLVRRFASHAGGSVYPILAPLVVRDAATARSLRQEELLAKTMAMFDQLTVAIIGIGSWDPPTSLLVASMPEEDRRDLAELGAVADMCATVLDIHGTEIGGRLGPRAMCISTEQLRKVPEVVAVAGGRSKARSIGAALRSGIVNTLITDSAVAADVLKDAA